MHEITTVRILGHEKQDWNFFLFTQFTKGFSDVH